MISALVHAIAKAVRQVSYSIADAIAAGLQRLRRTCASSAFHSYSSLQSSSELAESRLVFAEHSFVIRQPLKLAVRVDRVYDNGKNFILVELKTRLTQEVYQADIIELSAQRLALHHGTRRAVSGQAFVLLVHPLLQKQTLRRVELIPEHVITSMAIRRKRLLAGLVKPERTTVLTRCACCEYKTECDQYK